MRTEYQLTEAEYNAILDACKPVRMIALQCGDPGTPQENANRAWCALGEKRGFDGMTVEPSPKGKLFITAEPTPA